MDCSQGYRHFSNQERHHEHDPKAGRKVTSGRSALSGGRLLIMASGITVIHLRQPRG